MKKYDKNDNLVYHKDITGIEHWYEYNNRGYRTYHKISGGFEEWLEYDECDREIHYTCPDAEEWFRYDVNGKQIEITEQEFDEIKFREQEQEFLNRVEVDRFKLMEL